MGTSSLIRTTGASNGPDPARSCPLERHLTFAPGRGGGGAPRAGQSGLGRCFRGCVRCLACATFSRVGSYAVVWRAAGGRSMVGRLELDAEGLWLEGRSGGGEVRVEIPFDEIVAAAWDENAAIGSPSTIRVESRAAGSLLLTSPTDASVLTEILDALQQAVGPLVETETGGVRIRRLRLEQGPPSARWWADSTGAPTHTSRGAK
jgi:hypothetical protein